MDFPSKSEFVDLNRRSDNALIDVAMINGDTEEIDENLTSWEIVSVSPQLIEIDITFAKPLGVS